MNARRPPPPMPALAKQPSTRPNLSSVAFIAFATEDLSVTSQIWVSTLPGVDAMVAAALRFLSELRPHIETLQPAAASAWAMPRPIPPLPPVTTATRPVRSKMFMGASVCMILISYLERFRAKWIPVRVKKTRQSKKLASGMDKPAPKFEYRVKPRVPRQRATILRGNDAV